MEKMWGYGLGKNLQSILKRFWEGQTVVPRARGCYSRPFNTYWGLNQGDPLYPNIFKIVDDTVVRAMVLEVWGPQEAHHGLGWAVGDQDIVFYANNGRIAGRDPI